MSALLGNPLWFAARASGTTALVLLTATTLLGVAGAGRYAPSFLGRFEVAAVHRNLSLLSLALLGVHIATALADSYVPIGWISALVPFVSPYRTLWVGLGTLAFDLLLAIAATSAVRMRIGLRRWKAVHLAAYAVWPTAVFHAAGTGTDTRLGAQLWVYAVCIASVLGALCWRLYRCGPGLVAARAWAALASVALTGAFYVFVVSGPLAPGWSHRAQQAVSAARLRGTR